MKKLFLLFLILAIVFISCYITPEIENNAGNISMRIPVSSMPQRTFPGDEAGFLVMLTDIDPEDPNFENQEFAFYTKTIVLPNDVFTDSYSISTDEEYEITLDKVPEGDSMYLYIVYFGSDYDIIYDEGTIGAWYTETPFKVSSGKTTYVELTGYAITYYPE